MEKLKPWKTYSLDGSEYTWGYTILLPVTDYFTDTGVKIRFRGWKLYANDGGFAIESKYGEFSIYQKDEEGEDINIDEISKGKISERWISDHTIHQMVKDIFTSDLTKYS